MKFFVVENRINPVTTACVNSALAAGESLTTISNIDSEGFRHFSQIYSHQSTNSREFELICFRRYFLLWDSIKDDDINHFALIDSDVLIFNGLGNHLKKIAGSAEFCGSAISADVHRNKQISPHVSYWTKAGLKSFVSFLLNTYGSDTRKAELENIYKSFRDEGLFGGVSDMTLLYLWASRAQSSLVFTNEIKDACVVDHNISIPHNFEKNEFKAGLGGKALHLHEGKYYFSTKGGQKVQAMALHFQGKAKVYMVDCFQEKTFLMCIKRSMVGGARFLKKKASAIAAK